jgi:hypothetical protein
VGKLSHLFAAIGDPKRRLYLRRDSDSTGTPDFLMKSFPPLSAKAKGSQVPPPNVPAQAKDSLQTAADQVLLQVYAPAAVVLNSSGDIVYISGRTGKYLEPAAGKANWNIHAMVREGLRAPLADALKQAALQREPLHLYGLQVQSPGGVQFVDVTVQALHQSAALQGMAMIVFRDIVPVPAGRRRQKGQTTLEASQVHELQRMRDEIQT